LYGVELLNCAGSADELVLHGLRALRDTLPNEVELTTKVRSCAFVCFRSLLHLLHDTRLDADLCTVCMLMMTCNSEQLC